MKRLENKPFVLLGVNSDENKDKLREAMTKENITWRSWWDGGSTFGPIASRWNVTGWPTLYLIDAKGVIRHVNPNRQEAELDKLIDALVKEAEEQP